MFFCNHIMQFISDDGGWMNGWSEWMDGWMGPILSYFETWTYNVAKVVDARRAWEVAPRIVLRR